jgi:hypothetical protein
MFEASEVAEAPSPGDDGEVQPQASAPAFDPYGGVALGVECAWPDAIALHSR